MRALETARAGDLRLVATPVAAGSKLVRVHPNAGPDYDRMILVTEEDGGKVLHLAGWIGRPLTPAEWLAARDALFPLAETIRFERLRGDALIGRSLRLGPIATGPATSR